MMALALLPMMSSLIPLSITASAPMPSIVNCTWTFYDMPVDHFGKAPGAFKQRVCIYDKYHQKDDDNDDDLMFFYTGNESPVEEYVNNTGLMWELGAKKNALLVWAEHRYEPETHPDLVGTDNCFAFGTTAQALQDYVELIHKIKKQYSMPSEVPVVAFGGSYGGMLAGWMRIKYPHVIAGSIAASAPVWGLANTMTDERLDWSARAIGRGISKAGGATDRCLTNVRSAWPLIETIGKSKVALKLMGEAAGACEPSKLSSAYEITSWARGPWFDMAEGNFPFASTYITYSVGPGYIPLPPWPMRVACNNGLNDDLHVEVIGDVDKVKYNLSIGEGSSKLSVGVDWDKVSADFDPKALTEAQVRSSGILELVAGLSKAVGVWYNITGTKSCYRMVYEADTDVQRKSPLLHAATAASSKTAKGRAAEYEYVNTSAAVGASSSPPCAVCPPCDAPGGCPQCPVATCSPGTCHYKGTLSKTFSWTTVTCNEDLSLYNNAVHGIGHDLWWPPSVSPRQVPTVSSVVGPHKIRGGCGPSEKARGLAGGPLHSDPWSGWLTSYYQGANLSSVRNIVWSNGLLDPWSGGGVYPPGGGIHGPMVQNISSDGSQISLLIEYGAHHLDLFFANATADPPSATKAREIEASMIARWAAEWRAEHRSQK